MYYTMYLSYYSCIKSKIGVDEAVSFEVFLHDIAPNRRHLENVILHKMVSQLQ